MSYTAIPEKTALLVIDVQEAFKDARCGRRNNDDAEANIGRLLKEWRVQKRPIVHIKHDSTSPESLLRPGAPGNEIQEIAQPCAGEVLITKSVNSAFIGTDLHELLQKSGVDTLVIAGLTTDHCVSTTTRMAANLGYSVYLVADATATYERTGFDGKNYSAEEMHHSALVSLQGEFASIVTTEQLVR